MIADSVGETQDRAPGGNLHVYFICVTNSISLRASFGTQAESNRLLSTRNSVLVSVLDLVGSRLSGYAQVPSNSSQGCLSTAFLSALLYMPGLVSLFNGFNENNRGKDVFRRHPQAQRDAYLKGTDKWAPQMGIFLVGLAAGNIWFDF